MYKHILIATDGPELAEKAVKGLHARVSEAWAATCRGSVAVPFDTYEKAAGEAASMIIAVSELAKQLDAECATVHVKEIRPKASCRSPRIEGAISSSWLHTGGKRFILGSQATRARSPVQCQCSTASEPPAPSERQKVQ